MALQMDFVVEKGNNIASLSDDTNVEVMIMKTDTRVTNGYVKISKIDGDKYNLSFIVDFKANKDSETIFTKPYNFTPSVTDDSDNFIKQAYEYLKTLPEYQNAIDC